MTFNPAIDAFFSAMNERDADAAAALAAPDVEIVMGSHRMTGQEAIRELALQEDPQLVFENVPVSFDAQGDSRVAVVARRTSHWRENGELAAEEDLRVLFDLDGEGRFTRIEML
jgi:ketosteroid isomerase-like protein